MSASPSLRGDMQRVQRAARKSAEARENLEQMIRAVYSLGWSLRSIGEAAGMSHEQVRRILAR